MSTNIQMTANPSRIALPTYGRVLGMSARVQVDGFMCGTAAVSEHVTTIGAARTKGAFPGTSVWRPPLC